MKPESRECSRDCTIHMRPVPMFYIVRRNGLLSVTRRITVVIHMPSGASAHIYSLTVGEEGLALKFEWPSIFRDARRLESATLRTGADGKTDDEQFNFVTRVIAFKKAVAD